MSFHSLLNSIIDSQSVTKNSLINETGIDRSSFYQILSGKRIPTKDQITVLSASLIYLLPMRWLYMMPFIWNGWTRSIIIT